jgi:outer membrane cobalamin receptor
LPGDVTIERRARISTGEGFLPRCVAAAILAFWSATAYASDDPGGSPAGTRTCGAQEDDSGECEAQDDYSTVVVGARSDAPGTSKHIGGDELVLRGAMNLPEALLLEPDVEINESPKQGSAMQIRGFDERASLLAVDGIPVREVYDGHFDISSLTAVLMESVIIERGVTSVLHGPGSMGGVVTILSPSACGGVRLDGSLFGANPFYGRLLDWGGALKACGQWSNLTLNMGGGYQRSEGYALPGDFTETPQNAQYHEGGGLRDGSDYTRAAASLVLKHAPSKNKGFTILFDSLLAPRGIPPFEGAGYTRYWRFASYASYLAGISGWYAPGSAPAAWGFAGLRAMGYAHVHRDEIRDYEDATYGRLTTNPLAWFVASAYANETCGAALQTSWALNKGNRLDIALHYDLDVHREREIPVPRGEEETGWTPWDHYYAHTFSGAVEDTQVLGNWRLVAGFGAGGMSLLARDLRGKSYSVSHRVLPALEGRILIERSLGEKLLFLIAGGHKARFPTLKELFSETVGGNPYLEVERAWMLETGIDGSDVPAAGLESSVRLFCNVIQDLIEMYRDSYANVGRALTAGGELEVGYRPAPFLQLFAGYRYLFARDLENNRPLDYRTPHRVILGLRFFTRFGLTGAVEVLYGSGQRSTYFDSLAGAWQEDRLPGCVIVNGRLRYELPVGTAVRLSLLLDGRNLFDAGYVVGSFEPRPGREIMFGLGIRL